MKKILIMIAMALLLTGCQAKEVSQDAQEETTTNQTLDVKVLGATEHTEDEWGELADTDKLILLEVSITNNGTEEYQFNPMYAVLNVNSQLVSESDKSPKDTEVMHIGFIKPGETLKGFISYAVSKDVTDYDIYYEDYGNNSFKVE